MLDLQERLGVFIPQVQGKYINVDYETVNQGFGAQCWDLQAFWTAFLGLPTINTGGDGGRWPGWAGNMVDCFPQTPAIAAAYELIGPNEPGMGGDIPVWGDSYYWYPKTHVAVLLQDKGAQLLCLSQNSVPSQSDNPYPEWSTGPTTIQHLPRAGLIGFIRPRAGIVLQGDITTEDDMPITQEEMAAIAGHVWSFDFKAGTNPDGTDRIGKPLWLLQSLDAIIRETIEKTAAATAHLILNSEVPNIMTGGTTTLATQVSWLPQDFKAVRENITDAPDGMSADDFAKLVQDGIAKGTAGLEITLTTRPGSENTK